MLRIRRRRRFRIRNKFWKKILYYITNNNSYSDLLGNSISYRSIDDEERDPANNFIRTSGMVDDTVSISARWIPHKYYSNEVPTTTKCPRRNKS